MANSIDKRIVEMQFDNSRFERNVNQSISTLDRLKEKLDFSKNTKGFEQLERNANSIDFSGLERSITNIEHRFSALGIAGATVVSTLTHKVMGAVGKLNNAVFGQMKSGGINRALNLEHANFMMQGLLKNANKVAEVMSSDGPVQKAVKGTAYGLDAAANAAAQFIASGVTDLKKLEDALTGISGVAAMTSASYEDIASIFTTVAGQGKVMTMQLRQIEARGLNAAAALGEALNKSEAEIRDMVTKGKISFEQFSDAMNKAFGDQAKKANETFTGALSNVKAALSRIGAKVAAPTIENLRVIFVKLITVIDNMSKTLQPLIDFINNVIFSMTGAIALFLDKAGDIDAVVRNVVQTVGNAIRLVYSFILPIKRALEDIVPPATFASIERLTDRMNKFVKSLILGANEMATVRRIFRGIFGAFDIAAQALSALLRVIFPATDGIRGFIKGFANGAATIGDYIYAISQVLKKTDAFYQLFSKIRDFIGAGFSFLTNKVNEFTGAADKLGNIKFSGGSFIEKIRSMVETFKKDAGPFKSFGDIFVGVFNGIGGVIKTVSPLFGSFVGMVGNALGELANGFEKAFNGGGFRTLLALVTSGILATIAVDIAYFIKTIVGTLSRGLGFISALRGVIYEVSNTMKVAQAKIKTEALLNIAKAIGILVASIVALAALDSGKTATAIVTLTILVGELIGLSYAIEKFTKTWKASAALVAAGTMFVELAASIMILAGAMKKIADIQPDRLMDSLGVVTALLGELTIVAMALSVTEAKIKTGALSLIELSIAVKLLAGAVAAFGKMDSGQMIQGLIGVTVALIALAGAAAAIGETDFGFFKGTSIIMMAAALNIMGTAIEKIGTLPVEALSHGLVAIGAALAEIAVFMTVMSDVNGLIGTAAAIGILSLALVQIANAMSVIGNMGIEGVLTAVVGMGIALSEVGIALSVLSADALGCIAAAASITILAIALNAMIPPLAFFAANSTNLLPILGGLAVELLIMGAAAAAFGAGAELIFIGAAAIAAVSAACLVGGAAMAATGIAIELLSDAFERLASVKWSDMLGGLGKLTVIFIALGAMGILIAPMAVSMTLLAVAMGVLSLSCSLLAASITVAAFGISMLAASIEQFASISPETISKAIMSLQQAVLGLVAAAWLLAPISPVILIIGVGVAALGAGSLMAATSLIIFAQALQLLAPALNAVLPALQQFCTSILQNLGQILATVLNMVVEFKGNIFKLIIDIFAGLVKLAINGLRNFFNSFIEEAANILKAMGMNDQWVDIGKNMIQGVINGIAEKMKEAVDKVKEVGKGMIDGIKEVLKIHSPSQEGDEIGGLFDEGLGNGVLRLKDMVVGAVADVGKGMIDQAKSDANKVADVWEATIKYYGRNLDFDVGLKTGNIEYVGAGAGYMNKKTNELKNLISGAPAARDAINSINQETSALGGNTGATKSNSKAKKENEKANDGKTKAIDEETESLEGEEEQTNETSEAIREMAAQIEVTTEAYHHLRDYLYTKGDFFKITKKSIKAMGNAFSSTFKMVDNNGKPILEEPINRVREAFSKASKEIPRTSNKIKKGLYAFVDDTDYSKKITKRLKKIKQTTKNIEKQVLKTGATIAKVSEGYAKVFYKNGNAIESRIISLSKTVKNLGKRFKEAQSFAKQFENMNVSKFIDDAQEYSDYLDKIRGIEKFEFKWKTTPQGEKNFLKGILDKFMPDFERSMTLLSKRIDGVGSLFNKNNKDVAFVTDAYLGLASALYDGTDAANEYATQIAQLEFLAEHGEITWEEVEEAKIGYITRSLEALKEYYSQQEEMLLGQFKVFEEFDRKLDDQSKDLIGNIESQIAGFTQWSEMLMVLSERNLDFNLLKELKDQGVESFGIVKNMIQMTNEQLALFQLRYQQSSVTVKEANDLATAALANARVLASARAAAKDGKIAVKQMQQAQKAAKRIADDNIAVARNQAVYNKLSKKEVKEYLKTLTDQQRKEYKAAYQKEKARQKQLKKSAAVEEARRKEEDYGKTLIENVKTFKDYCELLGKYSADTKALTTISTKLNKAFEDFNDIQKDISNDFGTANEALLRFADTLDDSGQDGLNYFEEMAARVKKFTDETKKAITDVNLLTTEFAKAEKVNLADIYNNNILSNIIGNSDIIDALNKIKGKGYNRYVLNHLKSIWDSDPAKARQTFNALISGNANDVKKINAAYEKQYADAAKEANLWTATLAGPETKEDREKAIAGIKGDLANKTKARQDAESKYTDIINQINAKEAEKRKIADEKIRLKNYKDLLKSGAKLSKKQEKEYIKLLKKYGGTYKGTTYTSSAGIGWDIDTQIKKLKEQLGFVANEISDAQRAETESARKLAEAEAELIEYNNKLAKSLEELERDAKLKAWFDTNIISVKAMIDAMKKFNKASNEFKMVEAKISKIMESFTKEEAFYNLAENFDNIKKVFSEKFSDYPISNIRDGILSFGATLIEAKDNADEFVKALNEGLIEYQKNLTQSIRQSSDFFSMFKGFADEDNPLTATDYLEYADSQIDALKTWQENLVKLTDKGLDKELVEHFASQGLSSYEQVNAWANATEAQIGEYNDQWARYQQQVEDASKAAMASIGAAWSVAGQSLSSSMITYFNSEGADRLKEAGYEASAMVITGVKDGLTNAMPTIISAVEKTDTSSMAKSIGRTVSNSINAGLVEAVSATVTDTVNAAVEKFKMAVNSVYQYVNETLPTDWTITIHADTSEIDAAVARMNAAIAMTNVSAGQTSQVYTASQANQNSAQTVQVPTASAQNVTNVSLYQTNNSPKALSQVEIYKDTQNALNQTRNLIELAQMG